MIEHRPEVEEAEGQCDSEFQGELLGVETHAATQRLEPFQVTNDPCADRIAVVERQNREEIELVRRVAANALVRHHRDIAKVRLEATEAEIRHIHDIEEAENRHIQDIEKAENRHKWGIVRAQIKAAHAERQLHQKIESLNQEAVIVAELNRTKVYELEQRIRQLEQSCERPSHEWI